MTTTHLPGCPALGLDDTFGPNDAMIMPCTCGQPGAEVVKPIPPMQFIVGATMQSESPASKATPQRADRERMTNLIAAAWAKHGAFERTFEEDAERRVVLAKRFVCSGEAAAIADALIAAGFGGFEDRRRKDLLEEIRRYARGFFNADIMVTPGVSRVAAVRIAQEKLYTALEAYDRVYPQQAKQVRTLAAKPEGEKE